MFTILGIIALLGAIFGGGTIIVLRSQANKPVSEPDREPVLTAQVSDAYYKGDYDKAFKIGIVGEAAKRQDIGLLASGGERDFAATFLPEGDTVSVFISHVKVGQLAKDKSAEFIKKLNEAGFTGRQVVVPARIMGGHKLPSGAIGNYGVKLDLQWPPVFVETPYVPFPLPTKAA
jgi:hypothetical protein